MVEKVKRIENMAQRMRVNALSMALGAGRNGAHLGPAMSCMEILAVLYGDVLRYDTQNPEWKDRDRFLVSKAHCVLAYYTALSEAGFIKADELSTFEKEETSLAGHPAMDVNCGIEYSGGSLGMALPFGLGVALDAKRSERSHKIYVLLGDGECDEGSNWEAFLAAPHFGLDNLVVIIDKNKLQYDGTTDDVMCLGNLVDKLKAFGWYVVEIDGHDVASLLKTFSVDHTGKPYAIIANTVKGKGVSFMENVREWHHSVLSQSQYDAAIAEINGLRDARV
jgi:transketolase